MKNSSALDDDARRRLLIVEDDDLMLTFYQRLFAQHRSEFEIRIARRVADALGHIDGGKIDAVILDWDLPKISGIDLLRALRARPDTRGLPVLMVSGRSSMDHQVQALQAGADDYITKPFSIDVFMARLRTLLRR